MDEALPDWRDTKIRILEAQLAEAQAVAGGAIDREEKQDKKLRKILALVEEVLGE